MDAFEMYLIKNVDRQIDSEYNCQRYAYTGTPLLKKLFFSSLTVYF